MDAPVVKLGQAKELLRLAAMLTSTIGESLGSLVGREVVVRPGDAEAQDAETFVRGLPRSFVVARGTIDKAAAPKSLYVLFEVPDAITMGGLLMMTDEATLTQRRAKGTFESEDSAAFGELGNVLFAGFGNVLRDNVGNTEVRYEEHGTVKPQDDKPGLLGSGMLVALSFRLKIGEQPDSCGYVMVDLATAETWNKAPLGLADSSGVQSKNGANPRLDDEGLDSIPAVPIRGTLAAFVMQPEVFRVLRRSCRRVGLELRRHGRGEIPNPAAHRNEIVLMDVPPGEDRRFDWCHRIKELSTTTKVVLLIHHPSRHRVTQAFLSRADAILGFPCEETQLSQKLGTMVPEAPSEPPTP